MNKTKFAIGCLVQWYEVEMIIEYIETLNEAINEYEGDVLVDVTLVMNQDLEKTSLDRVEFLNIKDRVRGLFGRNVNYRDTTELHTIADYRREFNERYCNKVDVLVWGESDMLVPKQMFTSLDTLHQNVNTTKYLATFGICKMWDNSWKPLEHPEFTNKPFIEGDTENWWSIPYTMNKDEMNGFNNKVLDLDVSIISPHKFNGCGLVISSEVIKSGVNIPKSVFFVHEDTAFMMMTQKVLGNIPQYHFKNILLVHNRKHSKKRNYVLGEENISKTDVGAQRKVHEWYEPANKLCEENVYNLFNPNYKSKTWEDVWN
jgi:hypothetical protein